MALSTFDHEPPLTDLLADLKAEWLRQAIRYSRSVRLYQEHVVGRRTKGRELPGRRSDRLAILDIPREGVSLELAAPKLDASGRTRAGGRAPLTARQREIADLIAQGLTNGEIAARIVVSKGTVGNHIGHMLRRLGAKNRAEIAAWAIRNAEAESAGG